jgi:N-acetylmuramoyl-L-alanine amidase
MTPRGLKIFAALSFVVLSGCDEPTTTVTSPAQVAPRITTNSTTRPAIRYPTTTEWQPMSLDEAMNLIEQRPAWDDFPPIHVPRHPAEKYLAGLRICIDPGHGMSDGETDPTYKRGPTGVREDDINLRVALLLRRLLSDAGVEVILTRDADTLVRLPERVAIANDARADLFISIHHNASDNPAANYSSVWYRGSVDEASVALDFGKYVAHRLGAGMRTDVGRTSPLLSDQLMYPSGFGVLRNLNMPGVLVESSFFSNPIEEQRLRDAGYNLRTAYAIYEGLCEYAYGGKPTQMLIDVTPVGDEVDIRVQLVDGLPDWWGKDRSRIIASSINALLGEAPARQVQYDPGTRVATFRFPKSDQTRLRIQFVNMFKHHNWPQQIDLPLAR